MLKKLRIKLICVLMTVITAVLCGTFGMIIISTKNNLEEESLRVLQTVSAPGFILEPVFGKPDQPKIPYFVLQQMRSGEIIAYGIGFYDLSNEDFLGSIWKQVTESADSTGALDEYDLRYLRQHTPDGFLIACVDISSEQAALQTLLRNCFILGFAALAVFFFLSVLLARWMVKPVEAAWKNQQQFVADASHELKTPLTVILTNAELLQNPQYNEDEKQQFSDNILTMGRQMRGLAEGLLTLARVENGSSRTAYNPIDLSRLITNSLLPFDALFFEHDLGIASCIADNIAIMGDSSRVQQVLDILLDNAMKYSYPNSDVLVHLHEQNHSCILSVINTGDPISPADLKRIFHRFYRVDPARQMNQSYGLGLSIAERIVQEHGGKIWAESSDGTNRFHVQFPLL